MLHLIYSFTHFSPPNLVKNFTHIFLELKNKFLNLVETLDIDNQISYFEKKKLITKASEIAVRESKGKPKVADL